MIISKTPLRISFVGGGTDLASFYKKNQYGAVISASIDKYIYVILKKNHDIFEERFRLNYSESELVNDVEEIKNSIIRECIKFTGVSDKLYIATIADIPASSGLGSSSAFCVGLLNSLYSYKGIKVSNEQLAEEAAHIEMNILNRPMGKQDHYSCAIGGINLFKFKDDESVEIKKLSLSNERVNEIFNCTLSFWTGVTRASETTLSEQDKNSRINEKNLKLMREQTSDLLHEFMNDNFSIKNFGEIINKNWNLKKQLSSNITNRKIDEIYNDCLKNGAYGGKISGAGNGGFLNIIAEDIYSKKISSNLQKFGLKKVKFLSDKKGSHLIYN